jgi:flagellar P-ring protein precursor FlgI
LADGGGVAKTFPQGRANRHEDRPLPCVAEPKCNRHFDSFVVWERTRAARLKDLVAIEGFLENQLIGYGIVVGLAGTGDRQQTIFSQQSLTNRLERMDVSVSPLAIRVKNTAAVMVTAAVP